MKTSLVLQDPTVVSVEQKKIAAELKEMRHQNDIGSKWLRLYIGRTHPEVLLNQNFVYDIEHNRFVISGELIEVWAKAIRDTLWDRRHGAPLPNNPCDICGHPTGSWLHDTCETCLASILSGFTCRKL